VEEAQDVIGCLAMALASDTPNKNDQILAAQPLAARATHGSGGAPANGAMQEPGSQRVFIPGVEAAMTVKVQSPVLHNVHTSR
jgi:hypothetical protein